MTSWFLFEALRELSWLFSSKHKRALASTDIKEIALALVSSESGGPHYELAHHLQRVAWCAPFKTAQVIMNMLDDPHNIGALSKITDFILYNRSRVPRHKDELIRPIQDIISILYEGLELKDYNHDTDPAFSCIWDIKWHDRWPRIHDYPHSVDSETLRKFHAIEVAKFKQRVKEWHELPKGIED